MRLLAMNSDTKKKEKKNIGEERRQAILSFVDEYSKENGYAPSVREICKGVGLSSTSSVHRYLKQMSQTGRIAYKEHAPRTLLPAHGEVKMRADSEWIPILRTVSDGEIDLSSRNVMSYIGVPKYFANMSNICGTYIESKDDSAEGYETGDIVFFYLPSSVKAEDKKIICNKKNLKVAGVYHPASEKGNGN